MIRQKACPAGEIKKKTIANKKEQDMNLDTLTAPEPVNSLAEQQNAAMETILVIDDDPVLLKTVESILRRRNYRVVKADCGTSGLEQASVCKPNLILLDCMMPDMLGYDVCRQLRKNRMFDDIPIIFLTGKTTASAKAEAFEVGGADYIIKPVDTVDLTSRIKTHIELARSRSRLRQQSWQLEQLLELQSQRLEEVRSGQERLLVDPASFTQIKTAVRFQPAYEAGGDFYDIVKLGPESYGLIVADVAGHDLGTAYLTGALKALVASFTNDSLTVQETMMMLNSSLNKFLAEDQYATVCYLKYNTSDNTINIVSAGHPGPVLQKNKQKPEQVVLCGDVLGMHEVVNCDSVNLQMEEGDRLFLFSDGLIESYPDQNGITGNRTIGLNNLMKQIENAQSATITHAVDTLVRDLIQNCEALIDDDIVLMGIEF